MDNITAIKTVRNTLRSYLTDPRVTAGANTRASWIFADEPILSDKFPIIEIKKIRTPKSIISMGDTDYWEHVYVFCNLWFSTKNGFKITVDNVEYSNSQLVEYYLDEAAKTLKANFNTMFDLGVGGYREIDTTPIEYDPNTQLYYGALIFRVWYFRND